MITLSTEKGLVRIESWEDVESRSGFERNIDPRSVVLSSIIGQYHFRDLFACGLSVCRQPHTKGYLVATQDGRETNIGNLCGVRYFSVRFKELRKVFKTDRLDQERRERLHATQLRLPTVRSELDLLRAGPPPLASLQRHISALLGHHTQLPRPIWEAMRECVRRGDGSIVRRRMLTKQEREARSAAQQGPDGRGGGRVEIAIEERIGHLEGHACLSPDNDIRRPLVQVLEPTLADVAAANVDLLDSRTLATLSKRAAAINPAMRQLRESRRHALRLLQPDNLLQLEQVLTQPGDRRALKEFASRLAVAALSER